MGKLIEAKDEADDVSFEGIVGISSALATVASVIINVIR
jgi:hypothetical protein